MSPDAVMERTPELLRWNEDFAAFDFIDDRYRNLVSAAIGTTLRDLRNTDADLATRTQTALWNASDAALLRVVSAPDTSFHLMWERPRTPAATARFLCCSLSVEEVREGSPVALPDNSWSAIGDVLVGPTGKVASVSPVVGPIPLDLDSPRVRKLDPRGVDHAHPVWRPLDMCHRDGVHENLEDAYRAVERTNPVVSRFCAKFLKVIVLQQDDKGDSVSAYSTQQYPGRAVFSNPHLIDVVQTAESVVHEAIHAFLYMSSQTYPWGISDDRYDDTPKIVSPWTGTLLPVSTFLHACFVWYGLLNFWSHALLADTFPARRVRGRMSRAAHGFLGKPLWGLVAEADQALVFAPIRRAIDRMQSEVRNSLEKLPVPAG